jgi:hypothetical protein
LAAAALAARWRASSSVVVVRVRAFSAALDGPRSVDLLLLRDPLAGPRRVRVRGRAADGARLPGREPPREPGGDLALASGVQVIGVRLGAPRGLACRAHLPIVLDE